LRDIRSTTILLTPTKWSATQQGIKGVICFAAKAHEKRNLAEYEGHFDIDLQMLEGMLAAADLVRASIALEP